MNETTVERQNIIEVVNNLPDEVLLELAIFLDYLRYKVAQSKSSHLSSENFLLTIAGLGSSGQEDISARDEEILGNEIDPIHGWSIKSSDSP